MGESDEAGPRAGRLGAVALLLGGSVALSRLLGYVREAILAAQLGAGPEADAYRAAFLLPDLLGHFLTGGALSIAFIPFYTRLRAREGVPGAERLLAVVLGTLGSVVLVASALLGWWAEELVDLQFSGFSPETRATTTRLTRILLPAQIFFVTGGILRGVLMAEGRFATQALAPVLYNLCIIVGGAVYGASLGAEGFAWGALLGAFLGPFLPALIDLLRTRPVRLRLRVAPWDRRFLAYLGLAAPLMLGLSMLTADEWFEKWFGASLDAGSVAMLGYARMLALLPVGVVGQALATAALPLLARLWSEGRLDELNDAVLGTLRIGLVLSILAAGALFALSEPAVQILYQRGRFDAADTRAVAALLQIFCLAVPAWVLQQVAVRPFYARNDTWRPMLLSSAIVLASLPLYVALRDAWGVSGLAWAGVIAMSVSALATLALARWLHGAPEPRALMEAGARAGLVALVSAFLALALPLPETGGGVGQALWVAVSRAVAFSVTALVCIRLFGGETLRTAVSGFAQLLKRRVG